MRILVDGQALQTDSRIRGIGRYTSGLIGGLCDNGAEVVVLFNGAYEPRCSEAIEELARVAPKAKAEVFHAIGDSNSRNVNGVDYFLSSHLYQKAVNRIRPDIFMCPSLFEVGQPFICPPIERIAKQYPTVSVNYDLIPLEEVDKYLPTKETKGLYFAILRSFSSSDLILSISNYSDKQLKRVLPGVESEVIYGAIFTDENRSIYVQKKDYIFYCGGLDERKNVDFLCRSYSKLPENIRNNHPLYICCRKETVAAKKLVKLIDDLGGANNIILVEAEHNSELARLYSECKLFVFPSKSEGLGLPLIEALTFRAPVLSSQATSLSEIIDNPEALFSPYDENQLTEKLRQALTDNSMLKRLQDYSEKNQHKFTWMQIGQHVVDTLSRLISNKHRREYIEDTDLSFMPLPDKLKNFFKLAEVQQSRRTIYFDVSEYSRTEAHTGIQRVVHKHLQYLSKEFELYNFDIVYISGNFDGAYRVVDYRNNAWYVIGEAHPVANDWYISVDLCCSQIIAKESELIKWKKRGVKLFVYIYDIIFNDYPQFISNTDFIKVLQRWLRFSVLYADCILSDSETVLQNIKRWAIDNNINVQKTIFIAQHLGSDFNLKSVPVVAGDKEEFQFICVSTIEPRKGYIPLVKSFIQALDNGMNARLVVVGRYGWNAAAEVELLSNNPYAGTKIIWENNCSDERLRELYSQSDCYVFASYDEGFGLGVVEAAQFGLPLLLRDIPVFKEVAGKHALYFTDDNLSTYLREIASHKINLPSVEGMEVLTWEQSIHRTAIKLINLAKTDFFSHMKRVDEKVGCERTIDLISRIQEDAPFNCKTDRKFKNSYMSMQKYRLLSRIWPSSKGRQRYRDKYNKCFILSKSKKQQ